MLVLLKPNTLNRLLALLAVVGLLGLADQAFAQITFTNAPANASELCQFVPAMPTVTASSTCAGTVNVVGTEARTDGPCLHTYRLTRTWVATDACANSRSHVQVIEITDTQAPILAGIPASQTVTPGNVPAPPNPHAIDFCDPDATLTTLRDSIPGPCGGYTLSYLFTARDACGNEATRTYVLTVTDDQLPIISGVTPGGRLSCGASLPALPNVTASDNSTPPLLTLVRDTLHNLGGDTCMIVRRTWTATDDCGNTTTARQSFSFHDGIAPVLSGIPADAIIYCEALPPVPVLYSDITATDACDPNPGITFTEVSEQTTNGTCSDVTYNVIRTWTAVDECGNVSTARQILQMKCECCSNGIDDDDDGLIDDYDPQCNCFAGLESECDSTKMYFIPPVWQPSSGSYNQPSELVITTLSAVANVHIQTADGTTFNQTYQVFKGTPLRIPLTIDQLQTPNNNTIESNRGWVITSDQLIQPIYRIDAYFNKVLVTVKGPQGMGRVFRAGSQTNTCGTNDMNNGEGHFISVMATEDNTDVTIAMTFPGLGGINGTITRRLNRYQTYLIRDDNRNTTVSGSLITSTKPIVVTSGSQHSKACQYPGPPATTQIAQGMDGGIDQLVPNCLTGDEYVLVRGKGSQVQQYAILVANKNNTRIITDGDPSSEIVLAAGESRQVWLLGNGYEPRHFKANKPFYMFHVSGISTNNEVGMAIAAPVGECKGDTLIEFPSFVNNLTSTPVDNSVYTILPRTGLASLRINGNAYTSCATIRNVPNRPDLAVVVFENACLQNNNIIQCDEFFTAGMLVGINRETGTHGYLTAFKDRMSVYRPGTNIITTGYLVDTLCGSQVVSHCIDVSSCATEHSIAAVRQGAGTVTLDGGTCFTYTSPADFHGEDEVFVTLQNNQGLFQTVCLRYFICARPPDVVLPFIDTTVNCNEIPPLTTPTMSDECGMNIQFNSEETRDNGTCDFAYILYRRWTVWDDCGDSTIVTQTINVQDTTPPQAINIPSDTILVACSGLPPLPTIIFEENCDNTYQWTFSETSIDSTCIYNRTVLRTWEAWDRCGNTSTAVQRIELRDTAAPILSGVPSDEIVSCSGGFSFPMVTATDDCDPNPLVTVDSIVYTSICDTIYHVLRIWTATDACGQVATASQRLLVLDQTSPIILNAPQDTIINCGDPLPTEVPVFFDDCTSPVPVYTVDSMVMGVCPVVSTVYRRWVATDDCGHVTSTQQVITVIDTIGPVFVPLPDTIFSSCLDSVVVLEPTVMEACNLQLTFTDSMASGTNCNADRYLYRHYVATDNCGRVSEYTQLYYFQDIVPPFWIGEPRDTLLQCDEAIPAPITPNVADACSGLNPIALVERDSQRVCPARRWIFRTYTVSDWCGNLTTFTNTIIIDGCEPAIPALATAQAGCVGENIILQASVDSGYTTPVYLWQFSVDGSVWSDLAQPADSTTLTIFNAQASGSGAYRVVVANNVGDLSIADCSSTSPPVALTIEPIPSTTQQLDLCRGDTLFYLGDTLTQSITRVDTLQTVHGCDSLATLELNVFPFVHLQIDTVLCFGESLSLFGKTYDSSGTYTDTLITTYGCDTTLALTLQLLPDFRDTLRDFICAGDNYLFEGTSFNTSGTFTTPLSSVTGCDSSRTLILELANPVAIQLDTALCPGETLNAAGEIFSTAGNFTRTLTTYAGCDSILTINLSYHDTLTQVREVTLCFGETYWFGNQQITTAGSYRQQFNSQFGCDSNVVVNVTIAPVYDIEIREELCAGEIYTNNGYSFSSPGRWEMQFYTANGCDSSVFVTLVYRPEFTTDLNLTLCEGEPYQLLDTTVLTAGYYERLGQSMFGCDSLVRLTLDYRQLSETYIDTVLCFGESLQIGSQIFSQSTRDTFILPGYLGCDSTVFANISILSNPSRDTTALICEGDIFSTGGRTYSSSGIYRDTSTNRFGCDSVYTLILTVIPTQRDTIQQEICLGDSLVVDGNSYFSQGEYVLNYQTAWGCDSIVLLQLTTLDTAWTPITHQICEGDFIEVGGQTFTETGDYLIEFTTSSGCDSTVALSLIVEPTTVVNLEELLCFGESIDFASTTITSDGIYVDSLLNSRGCDSLIYLDVQFRQQLGSSDTLEICEGDSVSIGGRWYFDSRVISDTLSSYESCDSIANTRLIVHENIVFTDSIQLCFGETFQFGSQLIEDGGEFTESYTSVNGCDSTRNLIVEFIEDLRIAVDDIRMCEGSTAKLSVRGYNGPVRWTPIEGLSCTTCLEPTVSIDTTTIYTATAINCAGEEVAATATVTIDPRVNVSIVSARRIRLGEEARLVAVADNPQAWLIWREGVDVLCNGCSEVTVQPMVTTTYEVDANTAAGCGDREQLTLIVEDNCVFGEILIPNIITPNSDGANDFFEIRYDGIAEISLLRIYNRWGELVYETKDISRFWDATHHGEPVNPGVYVYYLSGKCLDGEEFTEQGNVTVVR